VLGDGMDVLVVEVVDVVVLGAGGVQEMLQIDGTFAAQSSLHNVSQQNGSTSQTAAAHSPQDGRSAAPASQTSWEQASQEVAQVDSTRATQSASHSRPQHFGSASHTASTHSPIDRSSF